MLNEDKVMLMTRMASYEEGKGKDHIRIGRFFRSDYIALSLIKGFFSITISYIFVLAIYIYYNFDNFMDNVYDLDFVTIGRNFGKYYLIALVVYMGLSYVVCMSKYIVARVNIGRYKSNLKKIRKMNKAQKEN